MIHIIVFSKDRPLQLHGCLTSLLKYLRGNAVVDVLVRIEPDYADAYAQLEATFSHEHVRFTHERNFSEDIGRLVAEPGDHICFMCDDVLTINEIDLFDAEALLADERLIGVSFRLGGGMLLGMFANLQPQPQFEKVGTGFLAWDMNAATGDWCYPFDVLGTIYRRDFIVNIWPALATARNPSEFEEAGSQTWRVVTSQHHYASWASARTVVPTPNVVQNVFGNGFIGHQPLDPLFLLLCWSYNMRLDVERYEGQTFTSWRIGDFYLKRVI